MIGKRQFSLEFLFFEVYWVCLALAMFRASTLREAQAIAPLFFFGGVAASGMAIGGLFGRPGLGAIFAIFAVMITAAFLLPSVQ